MEKTKNKVLLKRPAETQMSQKQKEILTGIILGDGSLRTNTKGKTGSFAFCQGGSGRFGEAHKKYIFQVFDEFKDWCNNPQKRRPDAISIFQ